MRYRKMSYSYAVVVSTDQQGALGNEWRTDRSPVVMSQTCWTPPTDVYETDDAIMVMVDVAAVVEEDLEVLLYDNALVVEGKRRIAPPVEAPGVYRAVQIRQGPFRVEVGLPLAVREDDVESTYERGLLSIILPKVESRSNDG